MLSSAQQTEIVSASVASFPLSQDAKHNGEHIQDRCKQSLYECLNALKTNHKSRSHKAKGMTMKYFSHLLLSIL